MPNLNLYDENTGNALMKGTRDYNLALKKQKKESPKNTKKEFMALKKSELIKKFHELIDPDHTENVRGETKEEIIKRILEVMEGFSGGKRNKTRKNRKSRKTTRK